MALEVGQLIVYSDLIDLASQQIYNAIDNEDAAISFGYSAAYTIASGDWSIKITNQNGAISVAGVTQAEIKSQLNSYMTNNGYDMSQLNNNLVATRNMINFYNALSKFIHDKVMIYTAFKSASTTVEQKLCYNKAASAGTISILSPKSGTISAPIDVKLSYDSIIKNLEALNSYEQTYTYSGFSSCSSSSSSCSSSSCSCSSCSSSSSSSSSYIVYMLI